MVLYFLNVLLILALCVAMFTVLVYVIDHCEYLSMVQMEVKIETFIPDCAFFVEFILLVHYYAMWRNLEHGNTCETRGILIFILILFRAGRYNIYIVNEVSRSVIPLCSRNLLNRSLRQRTHNRKC